MTAEQIPQAEALRLFLAMVAGADEHGFVEIRAKRPAGGMSQDWISLHELDRAARSLVNRGQTTDTYLGVAPRTRRAGGLDAIERVWCLWADCDGLDATTRLAAFRPLPSLVIRSGSSGHVHAYWPLRSPIPPEYAKRANRRLALALGADRNACDAARIMRPPRTFNHKHDPATPVLCTRLELDVYELGDVVGHLADDRDYIPPRRATPPPLDAGPAIVEGLARTVRAAGVGNRNASLFWAACRAAERDNDLTHCREALRQAALDAGLPEHEIDRTLDSALNRQAA